MKVWIIFNRQPYDGTDVTWNGLRLADKLVEAGSEVRLFLMNDAVDMARDACVSPEGYAQDLAQMLKALIVHDISVKVCGTCMAGAAFTRISLILKALKNRPWRPYRNGSSIAIS